MSQEVVKREVVLPGTYEIVELDSPSVRLAEVLDSLRELDREKRTAVRILSEELLKRMDFDARYTLREGPYELKGDGPGRVEYDGELLALALAQLVDEGEISEDAATGACEVVKSYKPKVAGIKNLLKRGGRIAELIEQTAAPVPDEKRRVSVKRVLA